MLYRIINLTVFAVMIFMNYLANALPLNNKTTGELSAQYPNLFVPANITFSIWGVIYLLLLIFVIMQFRKATRSIRSHTGWFFALSCLFNTAWIVAWHYEQLLLSMILMTGLLITLVFINLKIFNLPIATFIKAAFGIYLGWILIATIANVTALLVSYNWPGLEVTGEAWAIVMISIGAIITVLSVMRFQNPYIGISVVWAFIGIIIKRQSDYQSIVVTSVIGILVVSVFSLWILKKKKLKKNHNPL